jgi:hypothetical protein
MTVDLSTVKAGDILKLECGGELVVPKDFKLDYRGLVFNGKFFMDWHLDGLYSIRDEKHPFNIIAIKKREPEVKEYWVNTYSEEYYSFLHDSLEDSQAYKANKCCLETYKITLIDGEPSIEKVI